MKTRHAIILLMALLLSNCQNSVTEGKRITEDFNFGWRFYQGALENAQEESFDDAGWKAVQLPHDWSVEHPFTQENAGGATAFLPGGIGWYRKSFPSPEAVDNKSVWIVFDGVYTKSEVWINGHLLGKRPNGYVPFQYDLSPYLKKDGSDNIIAVKADRSAYLDCRWYPGSGIYRNVKLVTTSKVHIPEWGVFVTTPTISNTKADVRVQITVRNDSDGAEDLMVKTELYYGTKMVGRATSPIVVQSESEKVIEQEIEVLEPQLWDIEDPDLYQAKTTLLIAHQSVDDTETTFGIRTTKFDADKGFFLNGKNVLIKGVCLHHDAGLVGAAVPIGVWERRLKTLKTAGCNAIRTAHNPASEEFLDLCDRMGFLVQDEVFDEWYFPKDKRNNYNQEKADEVTRGYTEDFGEWAEADLKNTLLRDRNHPSVFMWSIGNEIEWTYPRYGASTGYWERNPGEKKVNYYWDLPPRSIEQMKAEFAKSPAHNPEMAKTAKQLSQWVKEIDTTRVVTANLVIPSISIFSGYADALDVVGLSYRRVVYDYLHENYPDKILMGTENWAKAAEWDPVVEKPYMSGIFIWTGADYMGESREWGKRGSSSGLIDFAGFKKPAFHMFKSLWNPNPHVFITTQLLEKSPYKWNDQTKRLEAKEKDWAAHQKWGWHDVNEHWNYTEGDVVAVEVYGNTASVELFQDGKSLGVQFLKDHPDKIFKWKATFTTGKLVAIGKTNTGATIEQVLPTAKPFAALKLSVDKKKLKADQYDVSHMTVQLLDELGNEIKHQEENIKFTVSENAKILGVDNGDARSLQTYQTDSITTHRGQALMIVQAKGEKGKVKVTAECKGHKETIDIMIH